MSMPANIRVATSVPFPAQVKGSGLVAIAKKNGVWTVSLNFAALLPGVANVPNPLTTYIPAYDSQTGVLYLLALTTAAQTLKIVKALVNAGPYAADPNDDVLIVKQNVGAAFNITVDWANRIKPLRVVDGKGDAALNPISITPFAGQSQLALVDNVCVINTNGGSLELTPLPDGTGAY